MTGNAGGGGEGGGSAASSGEGGGGPGDATDLDTGAGAAALLPDADLPAELAALAQRARTFAEQRLLPHARRIDEEGTFRRESVAEMAAAGLLGGPLAPAQGGEGWSPLALAVVHEEIGAVCNNSRGFLAVHTGLVAQTIARRGSAEQQARWLPRLVRGEAIGCFAMTEEAAGSDLAAVACRATATASAGTPGVGGAGAGWRIDGRKIWITNAGVADVALLLATVDPARGRQGLTVLVVELPPGGADAQGLRRTRMPGKELGHRGSDHAALDFDGFHVAGDAVLGGVGNGFAVAMDALSHGRLSVAAGAVGIHRAAAAAAIAFARGRRQFGQAIGSFQMVQERLADMATELLAARALVHRCARRRMAGSEAPLDLAAAKLYATEAAARAADQAVLLHGARGYSSAWPVERLLRDIMGLRIYEGTTLIQKAIVARALLR